MIVFKDCVAQRIEGDGVGLLSSCEFNSQSMLAQQRNGFAGFSPQQVLEVGYSRLLITCRQLALAKTEKDVLRPVHRCVSTLEFSAAMPAKESRRRPQYPPCILQNAMRE